MMDSFFKLEFSLLCQCTLVPSKRFRLIQVDMIWLVHLFKVVLGLLESRFKWCLSVFVIVSVCLRLI